MRKLILAADTPDGDRRLAAILAGHELVFVRTLGDAQRLLAQRDVDCIMIGVHFDDSRMFDLVRHVRASDRNATRPVVCMRTHRFASAISFEGLEMAARAVDCSLFLDLTRYADDAAGNAEVRRLLEGLLTP